MKITQEQYNRFLENMSDDDWKLIRGKMEEKMPEITEWKEEIFRAYSRRVVTSGFRKGSLN